MASDESMTVNSYTNMQEDDYDDDDDSSMMSMSRLLSIEKFDADEEEFSDDADHNKDRDMLGSGNLLCWELEPSSERYSLPATPTSRQSRRRNQQFLIKDYASESEAEKITMRKKSMSRSRRIARERRWLERAAPCNWDDDDDDDDDTGTAKSESKGHGGGRGRDPLMQVITRPKGGRRYLCMDLDEVKACRDLGFELDHHHIPTTTTTLTSTTSAANSPVATWRISSPGDDPRDVKARLKLWAQAVALVSTSTPRQDC